MRRKRVPAGLLVLVKQVEANADFYRVMLGQNGDPAFVERFRQISEGRYRYLFHSSRCGCRIRMIRRWR